MPSLLSSSFNSSFAATALPDIQLRVHSSASQANIETFDAGMLLDIFAGYIES